MAANRSRSRARPSGGVQAWSPKALSPFAWYRANLGVSLVVGKVAAWADQSGNGYHLSQASDSLRPTYVTSGARKGQPCIETTSAGQLLTSASVTLPRELALWVVTGTIATPEFALTHLVGTHQSHYLYLDGVAAFNVTDPSGWLYFARYSSWASGNIANRSLLGVYDGTNIDVFSNNVNENGISAGAPIPTSNQSGTLGLFCSPDGVHPSVMQIYEAAIFPAAQLSSATARARLQDYTVARYG